MQYSCDCIIAQLRGDFYEADLTNLGFLPPSFGSWFRRDKHARDAWGFANGLTGDPKESRAFIQAQNEQLTAIWKGLIEERLAA